MGKTYKARACGTPYSGVTAAMSSKEAEPAEAASPEFERPPNILPSVYNTAVREKHEIAFALSATQPQPGFNFP